MLKHSTFQSGVKTSSSLILAGCPVEVYLQNIEDGFNVKEALNAIECVILNRDISNPRTSHFGKLRTGVNNVFWHLTHSQNGRLNVEEALTLRCTLHLLFLTEMNTKSALVR